MCSEDIDTKINLLQIRNQRVEGDKAWEMSLTRRVLIAMGTYVIIGIYLNFLGISNAWLHAVVPTVGYVFSTLSLLACKNIWLRTVYLKGNNV